MENVLFLPAWQLPERQVPSAPEEVLQQVPSGKLGFTPLILEPG